MARSKGKSIVYLFLIAIVIIFLLLIGSRIFIVKKITITGNKRLSSNNIIKLSGIITGQNIFTINMKNIRNNLESDPYMEVTDIQRKLPSNINIMIMERKPAAVIEYFGSYIVMDKEGYILEVDKKLSHDSIPVVTGMKMIAFHVGQKLQSYDPFQVKILDELLLPIFEYDIAGMLSEINIDEPNNISLLTIEGLQVIVGRVNELSVKISLFKSMMPILKSQDKTSGILDISVVNCPIYKPLPTMIEPGVKNKR